MAGLTSGVQGRAMRLWIPDQVDVQLEAHDQTAQFAAGDAQALRCGDTLFPNVGMSASPSVVVYNNQLYVFHQGAANSGALYYLMFNGAGWSGDTLLANVGISDSPSTVVYDGRLYVFHQGSHDSGELWYSNFDGTTWSGDVKIGNVGISSSPGPVMWTKKAV